MNLKEKLIREQNEKDEMDELFTIFQENMSNMRKLINIYDEVAKYMGKIDNIAIIINNKIVELSHQFKKKGIFFYSESALESLILKKFKVYYDFAKQNLESGVCECKDLRENGEYMLDDAYKYCFDKATLHINVYKRFANEIWKFNLEKDILPMILEERNDYPDKEKYNIILDKYKQELRTLGYENVVNDLDTQIKDIPDDKEDFFKNIKVANIFNKINQKTEKNQNSKVTQNKRGEIIR